MLSRYVACVGIVVLSLVTGTRAQSGSNAEKEVLTALQQLEEAQARCQPSAQSALRVPDHTVIAPSGAMMQAAELSTMGANCRPRKPATEEDVRVRIYNGDTAIVTGLQVLYGPDDAPLPKRRFSSVWVKVDGGWKHANYQATLVNAAATAR